MPVSDYNNYKKTDLNTLKWEASRHEGNNFGIREKTDPTLPEQSIEFATVWVGHLLNETEARDRAKLITMAPDMLRFVTDFLSLMEGMTTKDFETGGDRELRDQAKELLDRINES